eukprot:243018-Pyramimonas_sp.AAC.1
MGVPRAAIGFYETLYMDIAAVKFAGASEIRFGIGRGVRQGGPSFEDPVRPRPGPRLTVDS